MVNKPKQNQFKSKEPRFEVLLVYSFKEDNEALKKAFNILFQAVLANSTVDKNAKS